MRTDSSKCFSVAKYCQRHCHTWVFSPSRSSQWRSRQPVQEPIEPTQQHAHTRSLVRLALPTNSDLSAEGAMPVNPDEQS